MGACHAVHGLGYGGVYVRESVCEYQGVCMDALCVLRYVCLFPLCLQSDYTRICVTIYKVHEGSIEYIIEQSSTNGLPSVSSFVGIWTLNQSRHIACVF